MLLVPTVITELCINVSVEVEKNDEKSIRVGYICKGINKNTTDWRTKDLGRNFGRTQRDQGHVNEASNFHGIPATMENIYTRKI